MPAPDPSDPTLVPGRPVEVAPGIRRLVAPNPGRMTGPGTNTYLVGDRSVLVVDPGPAIDAHVAAICDAIGSARVAGVLVTHTHRDHSPAPRPLGEHYLAPLVGRRPRYEDFHDASFVADEEPADGARYASDAGELIAVATPGHASNHVCWFHPATRSLLTGDHVLGTVSPVILPPDGDMSEYLDSLARLQRLDLAAILPGHGPVLDDPAAVLAGLVAHRLGREAKVQRALATEARALEDLMPHVYDDVDPALHGFARYSLLAHLLKLQEEGLANCADDRWSWHDG
jgi:glyoxylase-like metal-dependent hydrolase (beta-lactamase superfamily II)